MKRFAELYTALDSTTKTSEKVAAMVTYFQAAAPLDAAWSVALLTSRRPKRVVSTPNLHRWAAEEAGIPMWLEQECYDAVGDSAETIASILPDPSGEPDDRGLGEWMETTILAIQGRPEPDQREAVLTAWRSLGRDERFVFNKILTGSFRVGVSQELVVQALSRALGQPAPVISHRLMGNWTATAEFWNRLVTVEQEGEDVSRPYPFMLAHPIEGQPEGMGEATEWFAEWKWDGIRCQVVKRNGQVFVWSRGEELITARFPEIERIGEALPEGTVLDGELLAWRDDRPLKFLELQKRIGRKTVGKKLLADVPVALMAFDVLEHAGIDLREAPLSERRRVLEQVVNAAAPDLRALGADGRPSLKLAETFEPESWEEVAALREGARERDVEGLMLKRKDSPYLVGRKRGLWWKWKVEPMTIDAVLVYAQRGTGKRASLYTSYTFALWEGDQLVPFAKAYSGLDDAEIAQVDRFVRQHTREKFGPVRTVEPKLVMELAFEGIQLSSRHKSGLAVRFPRITRWRRDKGPEDANRLEEVKAWLSSPSSAASPDP